MNTIKLREKPTSEVDFEIAKGNHKRNLEDLLVN